MTLSEPRARVATIDDVAARAGVAPSTVSRTFSRPGRVSAATAQLVRQAAQAVGYHRVPVTGAPNANPTGLLAVVLADMANPVFTEVARGAQRAAEQAGYTVVCVDAQESATREQRAAQRFMGEVDGLILASSRLRDSTIRSMAKERPLVTLNRLVPGIPGVLTDGALGARLVAEHLQGLGHRAVHYLAGPETSWANGMRWRGLKETGDDVGLSTKSLGPFLPTASGGAEAFTAWQAHPSTAVLAYNDVMALGFMRAALLAGVSVPADVSLVGFDNSYPAQLTTPTLTSVASPLRQQGTTAMRHLIALLKGAPPGDQHLSLPARLVRRESTGPAAL